MKTKLLIFFLPILIWSCTNNNLKLGEGFLETNGGKVWYDVSGQGDKTPLVILHGGPGYPSYSLNQLTELNNERPVVMYDQLGCGRSDRITDTNLLTIVSYTEQLDDLLNALDLEEVYLYGHSWGTILGVEYFLKHPTRVKGMVLSSPCLDLDLWLKDAEILISKLPDSTQFYINQSIRNENSDPENMKEAINLFYNTYYTTKQPISEDMQKTIDGVGYNVYEYMWGKEDYVVTGTLKGYDVTSKLSQVNVPTFYLTGEFDAARPSTVQHYSELTPNSKFHVITNAGHQTVHDNPMETISVIRDFLLELEN